MGDLLRQVTNNPIDLFDHRLCQDLHLCSYFDCGDLTTANGEPRYGQWLGTRDKLTECPVAPARADTSQCVSDIYDPIAGFDAPRELWGTPEPV